MEAEKIFSQKITTQFQETSLKTPNKKTSIKIRGKISQNNYNKS